MSIEKQIAELKAEFNTRIAKLEKQLTKKGPVVPWVGALVRHKLSNKKYDWDELLVFSSAVEIIDSPLHPQFMPNDGVNPWPDDMEVQVIYYDGTSNTALSDVYRWTVDGDPEDIRGSRPACGWEEYLKERE